MARSTVHKTVHHYSADMTDSIITLPFTAYTIQNTSLCVHTVFHAWSKRWQSTTKFTRKTITFPHQNTTTYDSVTSVA